MKTYKSKTLPVGRGLRCRSKSGAVMVETAMVFVFIILPLTMAIIQFGIFYSAKNSLTHIAREGARFGAVYCMAGDNPLTLADEGNDSFILDHMKQMASASLINPNDLTSPATVQFSPERATRAQYGQFTVTVRYDLNKKSFFPDFGTFFRPGVVTYTAVAMIE